MATSNTTTRTPAVPLALGNIRWPRHRLHPDIGKPKLGGRDIISTLALLWNTKTPFPSHQSLLPKATEKEPTSLRNPFCLWCPDSKQSWLFPVAKWVFVCHFVWKNKVETSVKEHVDFSQAVLRTSHTRGWPCGQGGCIRTGCLDNCGRPFPVWVQER